jgi:hypothetical protein
VARVTRASLAFCASIALLAGCGNERNHDVDGFVAKGKTPAERAVLQTIATYRTTEDDLRACKLVTQHFIDGRFEGELDNCRQVLRTAERYLPDEATVENVEGTAARVRVDEPTSTESIYEMRREGSTWKIDDIVEASGG